ncbi:tRNA guanosine(15) transglycosylase TgtA [Candidatus Bathyarchaeota archaeon]|nr:tRNA guanosine(15) transglycosylase TgtA [Candidatus Bathyarchaeota archaeon]
MSFELRDRDLLGRIGRLNTKGGAVETPAFMPVINPVSQVVTPKRMREEFGCEILITNSYIIKKHFGDLPDLKVHQLLDYDGVITTDSGAYQILVYGGVETSPDEIIRFQQNIGSDIAVILDIPTGWNVPREKVEWTVEETLRRAEAALPLIEGDDTLWVGPVQGGAHLDLVERSAQRVGKMPFPIHALGSPTEVMENYRFTVLVDMIMAAKRNLPPDRPFHLFGAGHPMMFSLAVALGCDLFDSAAYALYAKAGRYLTSLRTMKLKDLSYLPCSCPICRKYGADELKGMIKGERVKALTEHNLHVTMAEMETVKQAIVEGTLWELMEARSRGHPALASAMKGLFKYRDFLERGSPSYKGRGVFIFDSVGLARPKVTKHLRRLEEQFIPSLSQKRVVLIPAPSRRPYNKTQEYKSLARRLRNELGDDSENVQICFYSAPFGVTPAELSETYPLSQFEIVNPPDIETLIFTAENIATFVAETDSKNVTLISGGDELDKWVTARCEQVCEEKGREIEVISCADAWGEEALNELLSILKRS